MDARAFIAYGARPPTAMSGFVPWTVNALPGPIQIPARCFPPLRVAFGDSRLLFTETGSPQFSIKHPLTFWTCLRGGQDCVPIDNPKGLCPPPKKVCKPPDPCSADDPCQKTLKDPDCEFVYLPCHPGYVHAGLS